MSLIRPVVRPVTRPLARAVSEAGVGGGGEPSPVDLFVIVGQSNADGRGDSTLSPDAPHGLYIVGTTISSPLADPVGGADTGSMWPSFSNEWFVQTGRKSAFVEQGTGSSGLLPDANGGGWSPGGTLRATAVTAANDAIAAINASEHTLGQVYFVWVQGESDATFLNGTTVTGALYRQALIDLAAYFKAQVPTMATMGVVQLHRGKQVPVAWDATQTNFNEIRLAQRTAVSDSDNLSSAFIGTHPFAVTGLMKDNLHYSQAGLNVAGPCAARGMSGTASPPSLASPFISASNYPDINLTAISSRTASHTAASGTTCLIVATSTQRNASGVDGGITATFGGVAMRPVALDASVSASPAGAARSHIFYLTDADFGSSLSGVTGDIVVSASSTRNMISWCAINAKEVGVPDWISGASSAAGVSSLATPISSNGACLVVACVSTCANSATAVPTTFTGPNELMDTGLSNGTRATQIAVGYSIHASELTSLTVDAAFGVACSQAALTVVAFRGRVAGEP